MSLLTHHADKPFLFHIFAFVLYGYGDREELSLAGADYIVQDIEELSRVLHLA